MVGCEGPSTPYRFLTSPEGLSKQDAFFAVVAFAIPEEEVFVQFRFTLSHFFFLPGEVGASLRLRSQTVAWPRESG